MPRSRLIKEKYLIRPDYAAWGKLKLGMTKQEVLDLLGPPRFVFPTGQWEYGHLRFPKRLFKTSFKFILYFDRSDRLSLVGHPFDESEPRTGKPSVPIVYSPQSGAVYSHYPRYFDVRWSPSVGTYPITYDIHFQNGLRGSYWDDHMISAVPYPHYVETHGGAQSGRLRIRAVNALGKSRWAAFSTFCFTR